MFDVDDWLLFVHVFGAATWAMVCVLIPALILAGRLDRLAAFAPSMMAALVLYGVVTAIGMARLNRAARDARKETRP